MADEPKAPRHIATLDGLRALAVTSVIVFHARTPIEHPSVAGKLYSLVAMAGWVGVDLFFVLSGFLITGILLDAKGSPGFFRTFYARRTLRIFPLYYAVLVLALVVAPRVFGTDDPGVRHLLAHQAALWTYTTNLETLRVGEGIFAAGYLHLTHLWSLAVEEQFYLVWPLLVFLLPRRGVAVASLALVVGAPILRVLMLGHGVAPPLVYWFTLCRADSLAVGALLAVLVRARPELAARAGRAMVALGSLAVVIVAIFSRGLFPEAPLVQTVGYSALAVLFGGVVLSVTLARGVVARVLTARPLMLVGRWSYGIYLFHYALRPAFQRLYDVDAVSAAIGSPVLARLGFTASMFFGTLPLAALSFWAFEKRLLALKDRWAPAKGPRPLRDATPVPASQPLV